MDIGKPTHSCNVFIHLWIILHRAGTQWIKPAVHPVVPLGKSGEVANDINFAQLRESSQFLPKEMWRNYVFSPYFLNIPSGQRISLSPFSSLFKDQRFILKETSILFLYHAITCFSGPYST